MTLFVGKFSVNSKAYLDSGWRDDSEIQRKSDQIYSILVSHYSEIMAMREQVQLIRGFLAA